MMIRSWKVSSGLEFEFSRLRHDDGRRRPFLLMERRIEEFRSVRQFLAASDRDTLRN